MNSTNYTILLFTFCFQSSFVSFAQESNDNSAMSVSRIYFSLTPASLFREERTFMKEGKFLKPTANRVLSFEPEIRINNRFNIKVPIAFGLEFYNNGDISNERISYTATSTYNCMFCFIGHGDVVTYLTPKARVNDLIFQVGLAPKFYLNKSSQKGIYLTTAFLVGKMDKYAVTTWIYGESFDTGNPVPYDKSWREISRSNTIEKNPYSFFRWELGIGYQIREWRSFSLTFETGISTMSRGSGKKNDNIYTILDGNAPTYYEQQNNNDIGFWGIRTRNREYDSFWKMRNRLHLTNRIGIRYHFK